MFVGDFIMPYLGAPFDGGAQVIIVKLSLAHEQPDVRYWPKADMPFA